VLFFIKNYNKLQSTQGGVAVENAEHIRFKGFYYHHTVSEKPDKTDFQRHCHNMYEIIYIKRGTGTFQVEGSTYGIYPGCLLVFRPREFHCINISEKNVYERLVVHFDESIVYENSALLLDIFDSRGLGVDNIYPDIKQNIPLTFERISSCTSLNEPERSIMAKLILNELLVILHNEFSFGRQSETGEKLITRIVNYINENIASPMRLEELAEKFYISKYHLGHTFKKYTGMPVMEYIIRKRVLMAQQLINDGYQTTSAATSCGFNDYSSFYRAYTKYIGVKPSEESK